MKWIPLFFLLIVFLMMTACTSSPPATPIPPAPPISQAWARPVIDCTYAPTVEIRQQGKLQLPAKGLVVLESHYLTAEDGLVPSSTMKNTHQIQPHVDRSCAILKAQYGVADCGKIYANYKVWNGGPTSSGGDGGGTETGVGGRWYMDHKLPKLADEMWLMNMRWLIYNTTPYATSMPPWPTKYLAKLGDKAVVVSAGYEQGPPASEKWTFGLQAEPMYFLGANNDSTIEVGKLKDQSVPYGPVSCK